MTQGPQLPGPSQAWSARPYPQVLRGPQHRWWRPPVGLVLAVSLVVALVLVIGVVAGLATVLTSSYTVSAPREAFWLSPAGLLATNLVLAALTPLALFVVWVAHGCSPGWVCSVEGRLRWRLVPGSVAIAACVLMPVMWGLTALGGSVRLHPEPHAWLFVVVVVTTTPLQAAGEEFLFRGWMTQAVASLVPRAGVGALLAGTVSTSLFALAHGTQDVWLFCDRWAFGALACWLAWRTGGLECGIALHTVNNLVAFLPAIFLGQLSDALTVTSANGTAVAVDIAVLAGVAALLARFAARRGVQRLVAPGPLTLPRPSPAPAPA